MDQEIIIKLGRFAKTGKKLQADYEDLLSALDGLKWQQEASKKRFLDETQDLRKYLKENLEIASKIAYDAMKA